MIIAGVLYLVLVVVIGWTYWKTPKKERPPDPVSSAILLPVAAASVVTMVMVMGLAAGSLLVVIKLAEVAGLITPEPPRKP